MQGKLLVLAPLLLLLAGCRQEQLLPVAHAAGTEEFHKLAPASDEKLQDIVPAAPAARVRHGSVRAMLRPGLHDNCYAYMVTRPKSQRASAVQARLNKADAIEAAFSAQTVDVDLLGDHANIMALQFPVLWPSEAYAKRVSSVIEDYFSNPDVLDYMCNAGFAQVRLSARGENDGRMHLLWAARITAMGLVVESRGADAPLAPPVTEQAAAEQNVTNFRPD
jgi:hypothetical protein